MLILAIDTASKSLSVALAKEREVLGEIFIDNGLTHSETLLSAIENLFTLTTRDLEEVELFAVSSGPGSFTGLRIGISTVNAFSYSLNKPCIGVSSLDILANRCQGFEGMICPILNARRGEVYTGIYEKKINGSIDTLSSYQAISIDNLLDYLPNDKVVFFTGDGLIDYKDIILAKKNPNFRILPEYYWKISASSLIELSVNIKDFSKQIFPTYVRDSEAVVRWKNQNPGETIAGL